ncbi:baseplate J/gp47 family protein [Komagataeibacter xylinus]|uniref:baseplate J/gp47 family protein n=1 Tax=Komagataeibacter xylinus TaxID=28448 RepID=UPI00280B0746|nr:baseplate J/gp47 family protein [Komagataeibacter xylinus]
MTLAIPTPDQIFARFAAFLDGQTFTATDGTLVTLDARQPNTYENVIAAAHASGLYEVYTFLRQVAAELMVTTATEDGLLSQHATQWGMPRASATYAVGNVNCTASADLTVPEGTELCQGNMRWKTTAAVAIAAGATGSLPVQAEDAGTAGNLTAGTTLTLVSPLAGVVSLAVDQGGIEGGADLEAVEVWRARIIDAIRNPPAGGNAADYRKWAIAGGATYVNVVANWVGTGTVGIIVLMAGAVAPNAAELAQIQAYIDSQRPVRGNAYVVAGQTQAVDMAIVLNPDTQTARADVLAQLATYFEQLDIGDTAYKSRISDNVSAVAGETSHRIYAPAADVTPANNVKLVVGTVSWTAPT